MNPIFITSKCLFYVNKRINYYLLKIIIFYVVYNSRLIMLNAIIIKKFKKYNLNKIYIKIVFIYK